MENNKINLLGLIIVSYTSFLVLEKCLWFPFFFDVLGFKINLVILTGLLLVYYIKIFSKPGTLTSIMANNKEYLMWFAPLISVECYVLLTNLEKNVLYGVIVTVIFFIVVVKSSNGWVSLEFSKLVGTLVYLVLANIKIEIFQNRILLVIFGMFWFGVVLSKLLKYVFVKDFHHFVKMTTVLKLLSKILEWNSKPFFIRTSLYFSVIMFPTISLQYFGYGKFGLFYLIVILHINYFCVSYYNFFTLTPILFMFEQRLYTALERNEINCYLRDIIDTEYQHRRAYSLCIAVAIYKYFEVLEKQGETIALFTLVSDICLINGGDDEKAMETPVNGFFVYGPGMLSFCISFL